MSNKPKFNESNKGFFLHLEHSSKYDNSESILGWHLQVQLKPYGLGLFCVKGREFPASIVNDLIRDGWFLVECEKGYFSRCEDTLDHPEQVFAYLDARTKGYIGHPVSASNYDAPYLKDKWR